MNVEELKARLREDPAVVRGKIARYDPVTKQIALVDAKDSYEKYGPGFVGFKNFKVEFDPREVFTNLPPVVKRSPAARLASLTKRLVDHWESHHSIPVELTALIAKEYERLGVKHPQGTPITGEDLRLLAVGMLEEADRRNDRVLRSDVRA